MDKILGGFAPYLYALLRIISGLMFAMHGSQKLFGVPGDKPAVQIASLMGVGGVLELVCGLLIALGLLTGYAAFIASGMMAVAFFMAHFPKGVLPIINGGELAVLYCFLFLYMSAQGAGVLSLDSLFTRSPRSRNSYRSR